MVKTMILNGKKVSLKRSESNVKFNLATMVALAERMGVPPAVLLNEALENSWHTWRILAYDQFKSAKEWGAVLETTEIQQRCSAALRALDPQRKEAIEDVDQAVMDRAVRELLDSASDPNEN